MNTHATDIQTIAQQASNAKQAASDASGSASAAHTTALAAAAAEDIGGLEAALLTAQGSAADASAAVAGALAA